MAELSNMLLITNSVQVKVACTRLAIRCCLATLGVCGLGESETLLILKGLFEKIRELECQGLCFTISPGFPLKNRALDYLTVRWEH